MFFQRILPALGLGIVLALGACKSTPIDMSGSYDLSALQFDVTLRSQRAVAVAVVEARPYVQGGEESDTFLGTERGRWGGEKAMGTASDKPLAEELTDAISRALNWRGVHLVALPPEVLQDEAATRAAFAASGAERLLILRLQDWRTDIYTRVQLRWRVEAAVIDPAGNEMAFRLTQGVTPLGKTGLEAEYSEMVVQALSEKLSALINYPTIADALQ